MDAGRIPEHNDPSNPEGISNKEKGLETLGDAESIADREKREYLGYQTSAEKIAGLTKFEYDHLPDLQVKDLDLDFDKPLDDLKAEFIQLGESVVILTEIYEQSVAKLRTFLQEDQFSTDTPEHIMTYLNEYEALAQSIFEQKRGIQKVSLMFREYESAVEKKTFEKAGFENIYELRSAMFRLYEEKDNLRDRLRALRKKGLIAKLLHGQEIKNEKETIASQIIEIDKEIDRLSFYSSNTSQIKGKREAFNGAHYYSNNIDSEISQANEIIVEGIAKDLKEKVSQAEEEYSSRSVSEEAKEEYQEIASSEFIGPVCPYKPEDLAYLELGVKYYELAIAVRRLDGFGSRTGKLGDVISNLYIYKDLAENSSLGFPKIWDIIRQSPRMIEDLGVVPERLDTLLEQHALRTIKNTNSRDSQAFSASREILLRYKSPQAIEINVLTSPQKGLSEESASWILKSVDSMSEAEHSELGRYNSRLPKLIETIRELGQVQDQVWWYRPLPEDELGKLHNLVADYALDWLNDEDSSRYNLAVEVLNGVPLASMDQVYPRLQELHSLMAERQDKGATKVNLGIEWFLTERVTQVQHPDDKAVDMVRGLIKDFNPDQKEKFHFALWNKVAEIQDIVPVSWSRQFMDLVFEEARIWMGETDAPEPTEEDKEAFSSSLKEVKEAADGPLKESRNFYLSDKVLMYLLKHPHMGSEILSLGQISPSVSAALGSNLESLLSLSPEQRGTYIKVLMKIDASPSQEIQRIKQQLLQELINSSHPLEDYAAIEQIFLRNNLPAVGKVFKIFEILHPSGALDSKISPDRSSPVLVQAGRRRRRFIIYRDLLQVHLESGNRSLRDYISLIKDFEGVLGRAEQTDWDEVEADDKKKIALFVNLLNTLYENSQLGEHTDYGLDKQIASHLDSDLKARLQRVRQELGLQEGQMISERLAQMFLKPLGLDSFKAALERMESAKDQAHARSLAIAEQIQKSGKATIEAGDLLKGVESNYIAMILQNGSVAKEFLGASSSSDSTPFDTDLEMVDQAGEIPQALSKSSASRYGDIVLVIRDRDQFYKTTKKDRVDFSDTQPELFITGVISDNHCGIRTGFPSTEIDFIVTQSDTRDVDNLRFEIVKNGFYIPIVNSEGKLIFTPEQYAELRRSFDGIQYYEGDRLEIRSAAPTDKHFEAVRQIAQGLDAEINQSEQMYGQAKKMIKAVLAKQGIVLKDHFDHSLLGAELLDTGSTSRHTNKPGRYDFDLVLRLDNADMTKTAEIVEQLTQQLQPADDQSHGDNQEYFQIRAGHSVGLEGEPDVDIGIIKKSELVKYASHNAVSDRLEFIKTTYGDEVYKEVLANIILAKQILAEGSAYKKIEDGGMGGLGVENWILLNHGNMLEAFRTFWEAAHDQDRELGLGEFQMRYQVQDAGVNLKTGKHDNFINKLKPDGYQAMLRVIREYLYP